MKNYLEIRELFLLNPEITFLNHGSFGACPIPIFEEYQKWQLKLEQEPVQFFTKTGKKQLDISKNELAKYLNCNPVDLVYMPNPTTAMNTVIKSLELNAGDEILSTNQEYVAVEKTWRYYCQKTGAKFVNADIELPILSKESYLKQFWAKLSKNTKIVFLSHISSPSALVFPIKEIVVKAKQLGLMVIVDGAHAPGHIPLDLQDLDADIYTGACHKWMLTPKGNTFLHVKKSFQHLIDPLIISWGYDSNFPSDSQFQDYHQYNCTIDFSAYLTTPKAIEFLNENDWKERSKVCREQLQYYYPIVAKELNSYMICPNNEDFLGQICSISIKTNNTLKLKDVLYNKYKIEIPIVVFNGNIYLRISFQAYNSENEIEFLIDALRHIKSNTSLLS